MEDKFILLIEDNKAVREALTWTLEYEEFHVVTAKNGQEGLDILNKGTLPPTIIYLDLMMPVIDGFEFRQKQKEDPRFCHIPTIITSAKNNLAEIDKMSNEYFLSKPFDLYDFLELIRKYFEN